MTATNSCGTSSASSKAITISTPTKYVATNGSNSNDGNSSGSPYLTLAHAISQVFSGCYVISVAAGTYTDDNLDLTSTHDGLSIVGGMEVPNDQSGTGDPMEIKSSTTNICQ